MLFWNANCTSSVIIQKLQTVNNNYVFGANRINVPPNLRNMIFKILIFRVSVNYGVYIKLTADILEIPCVGNNGIYIEEKGGRAGPFCAKKKMPAFVSRDVFFDIHIIVDTPLEVSFLLLNSSYMNFRSCQF